MFAFTLHGSKMLVLKYFNSLPLTPLCSLRLNPPKTGAQFFLKIIPRLCNFLRIYLFERKREREREDGQRERIPSKLPAERGAP